MCVGVGVCVYVYVCVCMYVCMCVCVCMCMWVGVCVSPPPFTLPFTLQVDRAWQLYQECRGKGIPLDTATHNALIRVASYMRDDSDLRWQLVKVCVCVYVCVCVWGVVCVRVCVLGRREGM